MIGYVPITAAFASIRPADQWPDGLAHASAPVDGRGMLWAQTVTDLWGRSRSSLATKTLDERKSNLHKFCLDIRDIGFDSTKAAAVHSAKR